MAFRVLGRSVFAAILVLISAAALAEVPTSQHVILVIDENTSFSAVTANMPWLVSQGNANGYATKYTSDTGGSLMDYLWLASGSCHSTANCALAPGMHDFNCSGKDCYYPGLPLVSNAITDDNIFRELNNHQISWKVYAQSYAAAGGTVTTPDNHNGTSYYRRHNGATWYSDILGDVGGSAEKVVDLSELSTDLANGVLPRFAIIVPDGNHDAHDCPVGLQTCTQAQKLAATDNFLSTTLGPILNLADFQPGGDGLIFVTFDECGGGTNNGCGAAVYTAVIGPKVIPHTVSAMPYKHENTLRTMLDALGINTYPGMSAITGDMFDFFTKQGDKPVVQMGCPGNLASVSAPFLLQASAIPGKNHTISGWYVYVDGAGVYNTGAVNAISPSLSLTNGQHIVTTRAWDTSGAFGDQSVTLTVGSGKPTVAVSTPTYAANLGLLVNIIASASPSPGRTISGWWIYVDGVGAQSEGAANAINANVSMAEGTHTVLVRAWDTSGAFGDQTLFLTVSNKPAVAVSTPLPGSNVISTIPVKASATPGSGQKITGWYVYVDGVAKYNTGAVSSISTNVSASSGSHTVRVRTWDSSGAYGDQIFIVQVRTVAVNVSTPLSGVTVGSPENIQASALSAQAITGWHVYVDGIDKYGQSYGGSLNASVPISSGTHSVLVRAWDSTGAYGDSTLSLTAP